MQLYNFLAILKIEEMAELVRKKTTKICNSITKWNRTRSPGHNAWPFCCRLLSILMSRWSPWDRGNFFHVEKSEAVHVWYCLVHLCFLNEAVNKNKSLRILLWIFWKYVWHSVILSISSFSVFCCRKTLSGALGHHQSYKMHNIMKKHINESKW